MAAATTASSDTASSAASTTDNNANLNNASSSSLGSDVHSHSTGSVAAIPEMGPYIRVMRDQLNFFMTRLLFMQEDQADSLGAQTATSRQKMLWNNSNSSGLGSGLHGSQSGGMHNSVAQLDASGTNLLGVCVEVSEEEADVLVYQDNARMLTNASAKSMPPIPAPPAAPESPKAVEGRKGLIMVTPGSSHTTSTSSNTTTTATDDRKPAARSNSIKSTTSMPDALPLAELDLQEPTTTTTTGTGTASAKPPSLLSIAPTDRIFPKNRSRAHSKSGPRRHSSAKSAIRRSKSNASKASSDDDAPGDLPNLVTTTSTDDLAKSLH